MKKIKLFTTSIILFTILTPINFIHAQSEWKYDLGLYAWLAGIDGSIGLANQSQVFSATASDLLENLTFSAGGHFEARSPQLTFILDIFYAGLSIDASPVTVGDTTFTPNATVKSDEWILEGAFGYRIIPNLEGLFTVRYFILDDAIEQDGNTLGSASQSWAAFYLGARYSKEFNEKWFLGIRGDVGYGGDGFAWAAIGTAGYRFSKLFSLALSYKILNMDYESGSGLDYFSIDANNYGFGIAGVFSF